MGDFNPPSTADYAWSDAQDSLRRVRALEERVQRLERQIEIILQAGRASEKGSESK